VNQSLKINYILGVRSIHNEKAIHQDIKPTNILLDEQGNAFLADLGSVKQFENTAQSLTTYTGTKKWMAPEIRERFEGRGAPPLDVLKTDVFSLGLVSLKCLDYKGFVFQTDLNTNPINLLQYLRKFRYNYPRKKAQIMGEIPREKIDLGFYYMLRCILSFDILTRPSIEEVYKDTLKFISQIEVMKFENIKVNDKNTGL
jgi:serine/threonine protein kinase